MTLNTAGQIAAQSLALAQALGLNPAEGGLPSEGGTRSAALTPKGRLLLDALARSPKGAATPDELLDRFGEAFAGWTQAAFHETAKRLANAGWVERKRRMVRSRNTGKIQGGSRMYKITDAGRKVL